MKNFTADKEKRNGASLTFRLYLFLVVVIAAALLSPFTAAADDSYTAKVNAFVNDSRWKHGASYGTSQTPKSYSNNPDLCWSCYAYTADFVHEVWNAPAGTKDFRPAKVGTKFTSVNDIRAGDVIHTQSGSAHHYYCVLERYSDGSLWTAEGNYNNNGYHQAWVSKKRYTISKPGGSKSFVNGWHMPGTQSAEQPQQPVTEERVRIFFDLTGGTFDGTRSALYVNNINSYGGTNELDVFNKSGEAVRTNGYWNIISVDSEGRMSWASNYGYGSTASTTVPRNGFVVRGHVNGDGSGGSYIANNINKGAVYAGFNAASSSLYFYHQDSYDYYLYSHKTCRAGGQYGDLMTSPSREGYVFMGWYTSESGGTRVTSTSTVTATTLYAHWSTSCELGDHPQSAVVTDAGYAATCIQEGLTDGTHCALCGEIFIPQRPIEKLAHSWDAGAVTRAATCAAEGVKTYTCTVCKTTRTEPISRLTTHSWDAGVVTRAATCAAEGVKTYTCTVCKTTRTEPISRLTTHSWDAGVVTRAATYTEAGVKTYTCAVCKVTRTESITRLMPAPTQTPETTAAQPPVDGVTPEKPARISAVQKEIVSKKSDDDRKGSTFFLLRAKGVMRSGSSIKLTWNKVAGAKKYVIYGTKCGKTNIFRKIVTVQGTSYTHKNLKKGQYYKYIVIARNGDKALATSKIIHVATGGGKYGNYKSIKLNKTKITLSVGKKKTIVTKVKKSSKKINVHRKLKWESSKLNVATVNANGRITAVGKGTCWVYAYLQNGLYARVKVTVK